MTPSPLHATPIERRRNLAKAVAQLALAIAAGELRPEPVELQALAAICDDMQLPIEAARVRRWMGQEPRILRGIGEVR